jgi:7-carboxy-7-deazaguanine synthase
LGRGQEARLAMLKVNEIFYSIQGEGLRTGQASVFVRLSGCNLNCPFCDTDHSRFEEMTEEQIIAKVTEIGNGCRWVVLTGGEPLIQPVRQLIVMFRQTGYKVQVETNGTLDALTGDDGCGAHHLTVSPKGVVSQQALGRNLSEIKVVARDENDVARAESMLGWGVPVYLQPVSNDPEAIKLCVKSILKNPELRLSVQLHKLIGIP